MTQEIRRTEAELLERARRLRLASPARPAVARDSETDEAFCVADLQRAIGEEGALLEYGVMDDELFACVVTLDGVELHRRLASWSAVLEALRAARFQIDTLRHGMEAMKPHMASLNARANAHMCRLHSMVWAPLAASMNRARKVIVVPCAQLGWLPFCALREAEGFLAQRIALATAPSARLALRGLVRQVAAARHALVVGESSRLPNAAAEADFVAGLFAHCTHLGGPHATVAALQAHAEHADVIHLACHAQFRSDNPMFSALHLQDGVLTVERAQAMRLRPGIVVLSACETGLSRFGGGDEMVGLVRAFLVAGAARVVASLWSVNDGITAAFMASFYAALCRGAMPADALRQAQIDVMRQHPHPFHWAAFTLHGGW